jgi:hypothetical protein
MLQKMCASVLEAQQHFRLFFPITIYPLFMLVRMCQRSCRLERNA